MAVCSPTSATSARGGGSVNSASGCGTVALDDRRSLNRLRFAQSPSATQSRLCVHRRACSQNISDDAPNTVIRPRKIQIENIDDIGQDSNRTLDESKMAASPPDKGDSRAY